MIILNWRVVGEGNLKVVTYIIPTNSDFISASPCDHHIVTSHYYNCSKVTLNELIIHGYEHVAVNGTDSHDVVLLSGTHLVNSTQTQNLLFSGKDVSHLRLQVVGDSKAYVICEKGVSFAFLDIEETNVSSIHFKNCNGFFDGDYHNTLIFVCSGHHECVVTVTKVEVVITNANDGGIAVIFNANGKQYFTLANSRISTKGIGVNILTARSSPSEILVISVYFRFSCFVINGGTFNGGKYGILNVSFTGCSCSSVLSVRGSVTVVMNNVTVNDTESQYLVYSNMNGGKLSLKGQCCFSNNRGAIMATGPHHILVFSEARVKFINNNIGKSLEALSSIIIAVNTRVTFDNSHVIFKHNYGSNCGGIAAINQAIITFKNSKVDFLGNRGEQGGAMSFYSMSILSLNDHTKLNTSSITFFNNRASKGGALFVDDNSYVQNKKLQKSVFDFHGIGKVHVSKVLKFSNNTAELGGNDIYGGWVDWFVDEHLDIKPRISTHILHFEDDMHEIASDPTRVCICIDNAPNCNITAWEFEAYPGQTVIVDAVAVGQRFGTVATRVKANIEIHLNESKQTGRTINKNEIIQSVKRNCTALKYTIMTPNKVERLSITPRPLKSSLIFEPQVLQNYPDNLGLLFEQFSIKVYLNKCPIGFLMNKTEHKCICSPTLISYGFSCNLTAYVYKFPGNIYRWASITKVHTRADENPGIMLYHRCPYDYCRSDLFSTPIQFEYPDEQCAFNRSGILCGGCQTNFSRVLGSSKCKKCSNIMLLAILPSITLAGLLLVIFLMVLNLTVSVGTINGLIFYANVIQIQHATFFTPESSNSFLSVFIAWLNLDLGIESCFYDGFDAYAEMWLQFCFPLYIWLTAIIIIVSSHYSSRVSKLSSKNAVQVLATLFLLSYTKLLRLAVDVVSAATIVYPDGHTKAVLLYDGNVDFLKSMHIPLFVATLSLLIVLSVPYTFSLVSIQWLFKISHYRFMFWVQRLKPFFDAYTGPYKANHRYWTGLLLIVRILLLIVLSVASQDTLSLYVIILFSCVLQIWLYFTRWVYESFLNNCLEMIFLFNLGLTSMMMLRYRQAPAVIYISTGVTFVIFVGIILYHALIRLISTKAGAKLKKQLTFFHFKIDERLLQMQISESDKEIESDDFSCQAERIDS